MFRQNFERRPVFQTLDPQDDDDDVEIISNNKSSENSTDVFHIEDFLTPGRKKQLRHKS